MRYFSEAILNHVTQFQCKVKHKSQLFKIIKQVYTYAAVYNS